MAEKHVFSELVRNDSDLQDLLAYALYKRKKHKLAVALVAENLDGAQIKQRLDTFRENVLSNEEELNSFRDVAASLVQDFVNDANKIIQKNFDEYRAGELAKIDQEAKKLQGIWLKKVKQQIIKDRVDYVMDALKMLATFLVKKFAIISIGILLTMIAIYWLADDQTKDDFVDSAIQKIGTSLKSKN